MYFERVFWIPVHISIFIEAVHVLHFCPTPLKYIPHTYSKVWSFSTTPEWEPFTIPVCQQLLGDGPFHECNYTLLFGVRQELMTTLNVRQKEISTASGQTLIGEQDSSSKVDNMMSENPEGPNMALAKQLHVVGWAVKLTVHDMIMHKFLAPDFLTYIGPTYDTRAGGCIMFSATSPLI